MSAGRARPFPRQMRPSGRLVQFAPFPLPARLPARLPTRQIPLLYLLVPPKLPHPRHLCLRLKRPASKEIRPIQPRHRPSTTLALLLFATQVGPNKKGSFFIGQAVQADGAMLVATPMDPCFLLLPMMLKAERYQPLDQIDGMEGVQPVLQLEGLNGWLERICDVKDLGDGPLNSKRHTLKP